MAFMSATMSKRNVSVSDLVAVPVPLTLRQRSSTDTPLRAIKSEGAVRESATAGRRRALLIPRMNVPLNEVCRCPASRALRAGFPPHRLLPASCALIGCL